MRLCALLALVCFPALTAGSTTPQSEVPSIGTAQEHDHDADFLTDNHGHLDRMSVTLDAVNDNYERNGHSPSSIHASVNRRSFELATPFDAKHAECKSQCDADGIVSSSSLAPFLNPCPVCLLPDEYCGEQCRSCCHGGASSLKLGWRACPGTLSLASHDDLERDCGYSPTVQPMAVDGMRENVRFISCECYDAMIRHYLQKPNVPFGGCVLSQTHVIPEEGSTDHEICIVANGSGNDAIDWIVDLTVALPPVIGLVLTPPTRPLKSSVNSESSIPDAYSSIHTYIDTSCSASPVVRPVFAGYGKFLHSCPHMAFIDLQRPGKPPLPNTIDHFTGEPPMEIFWIEFLDGTSKGFWPAKGTHDAALFLDPTFAMCDCQECVESGRKPFNEPLQLPSTEPLKKPALPDPDISFDTNSPKIEPFSRTPSVPTAEIVPISPLRKSDPLSIQPSTSQEPSASQCAQVALVNCRMLATDPKSASPCVYGQDLQQVLKYIQSGDEARGLLTILDLFKSGAISKEWLIDEIGRNQVILENLDHQTETSESTRS